MNTWLSQADEKRLREDRRFLHAHAETGFALEETCRYVSLRLTQMGLRPKECGRCGLTAEIGRGAPCVLLRADMDALAIREETGLPFACPDGRMHACGHDLHTAMLLEAARLLKAREGTIRGTVRLMFQPAEELLQGAADMLAHGLLEEPRPVAAFMIHVLTGSELPAGTVIVSSPGTGAPAADLFEIRLRGRGCHGAMPHIGADPVLAAAQTILSLQQIQTRELSAAQPCVLTVGAVRAGEAANVIPDSALLRGSLRTFDDETRRYAMNRVEEIAVQTAKVCRVRAEVAALGGCPTLLNDETLSRTVHAALQALLGKSGFFFPAG